MNRLARKNAIVELGKKTTRMNYRESCHVYCFSVLNVDHEDPNGVITSKRRRSGTIEE
ncbi:MAG TPA: hypothetical protein VFI64_04290 [Nitrososphaeraceae archaeon]|nr:hypothetical protein [Nitrososphaeraceae archaeon]